MKRRVKDLLRIVVVIVAVIGYFLFGQDNSIDGTDLAAGSDDAARIVEAFETQTSDLWVTSGGVVDRTLKDDLHGSAHQRFIVHLSNGHSVLIAHNIDLAPRVPLSVGDRVSFRGEFEWNDRGGVVHWTHHDPSGRKQGGWIRHAGKTFE